MFFTYSTKSGGEEMKTKHIFGLAMLVGLIVGLWFEFMSPQWGYDAGYGFIIAHGGSMDTNEYHMIMQAYIDGYRQIGGILLGVCGIGSLLYFYLIEKGRETP